MKLNAAWHRSEAAKPSRTATVNFNGERNMIAQLDARLLPGGELFFIVRDMRLELWSVNNGKLIWKMQHSEIVTPYDFEVINDEEVIVAAASAIDDGPDSQ